MKSLKAWVTEGAVKSVCDLQEPPVLQQSRYLFRVSLGLDSPSQGRSIDGTCERETALASRRHCGAIRGYSGGGSNHLIVKCLLMQA